MSKFGELLDFDESYGQRFDAYAYGANPSKKEGFLGKDRNGVAWFYNAEDECFETEYKGRHARTFDVDDRKVPDWAMKKAKQLRLL